MCLLVYTLSFSLSLSLFQTCLALTKTAWLSHYVPDRIFPWTINQVRSTVKQTAAIFTRPETLAQNSAARGKKMARGRGRACANTHTHGCTQRQGVHWEKRRVEEKKKKNVGTNRAFDGRGQKYRHKFRTVRHRHTDQNLPQRSTKIYAFICFPTRLWIPIFLLSRLCRVQLRCCHRLLSNISNEYSISWEW